MFCLTRIMNYDGATNQCGIQLCCADVRSRVKYLVGTWYIHTGCSSAGLTENRNNYLSVETNDVGISMADEEKQLPCGPPWT